MANSSNRFVFGRISRIYVKLTTSRGPRRKQYYGNGAEVKTFLKLILFQKYYSEPKNVCRCSEVVGQCQVTLTFGKKYFPSFDCEKSYMKPH